MLKRCNLTIERNKSSCSPLGQMSLLSHGPSAQLAVMITNSLALLVCSVMSLGCIQPWDRERTTGADNCQEEGASKGINRVESK